MNYRLPLTLVLLVACNPSPNIDLGESDSAQSGTQGTAGSTGANTGDVPTGSGSGSGGSQTSSEQSGSQSASQSGSETTEDTAVTGTSGSSGADDTTSGSSSTGSTGSTGQVDTSTGGGCMPKIGGPAAVVLGDSDDLAAAGAYAVLAKTAITSVPKTAIAGGHVGISPAAASDMTGFALVLDPTGVFATSKQVVAPGRVYAADYTVPTPVNLTTAVLGMQAAYIDAAGRVPTDYLDLKSGDIGGLTLGPGIYTWGSTVLVPKDVTIEGCEDDVWIFQISGDLDVSTGRSVILAGGARAENIFWQVAGQATIHATAHLEGVILSKTGITFQTKASLHGRALAQTMVAFDNNAITAP
jgi:hypothetical protein